MNYRDNLSEMDLMLASWARGEADAVATTLVLEGLLTAIRATNELKSNRWLVPQIEAAIAKLSAAEANV